MDSLIHKGWGKVLEQREPEDQYEDLIEKSSKKYFISPVQKDYLYVTARALTIGVPNANGDLFIKEELLKEHSLEKVPSYLTYVGKPVSKNHRFMDVNSVVGVVLDAQIKEKDDDSYVEVLMAIDCHKDPDLCRGIVSGRIRSTSMGCIPSYTSCSYCKKKIYKASDLCKHLKFHRLRYIDNILVAEVLHDVRFIEHSIVSVPADKTALIKQVIYSASEMINRLLGYKVASMFPVDFDAPDFVDFVIFVNKVVEGYRSASSEEEKLAWLEVLAEIEQQIGDAL